MTECISCDERAAKGGCADSDRTCGHHCNHAWTDFKCCWCREEFLEDTE